MRYKDVEWQVPQLTKDRDADGAHRLNDNFIIMSVLMDIRDELKSLNAVFHCSRFFGVPTTLDTIARNTIRRRRRKPR